MRDPSPTLTKRARSPRTKLWSWEALRYRGSGWWLDAALPRTPAGLTIVAFAIPLAWFAVGSVLADDRDAFFATHDVTGQLWFFPLHIIALRVVGSLWASGLGPALDGLALDPARQRRIRRGALGTWASIGAILACAFFIIRDCSFGLSPDPTSNLLPFDDPEMWDMAALGRPVHLMMLGLWCVEWLMFGYLLWLPIWILVSWTRELRTVEYGERLGEVLVGDGYRRAFTLFSKTTTVSLVFALGNLGFIAFTGELIPREVVELETVGDFIREMSDLLSTSLLFVLTLIAVFTFVRILRASLTRAVAARFADAGDAALAELANPFETTGDLPTDVEHLRTRAHAQAGLLRAIVYQRAVDNVGSHTMATMVAKALIPLVTAAIKLRKVLGI